MKETQDKTPEVSTVHFTLQGKGGVGKSFVSSLIAQYMMECGGRVICIDTDPVNATLSGYQAFGAQRLVLFDEGSMKINERHFDTLVETIMSSNGADIIVDNGASSFLPLSSYLVENDVIDILRENHKKVLIHSVITGGQALIDTLTGFEALASQVDKRAELVVWLNEYFGEVRAEGKGFEGMAVYQKHKQRVRGIVRIPRQNGDTFGKDIQLMLEAKKTFDEAVESAEFSLMAKQRLKMTKRLIFDQLKNIHL